jgi:hypothetical protein
VGGFFPPEGSRSAPASTTFRNDLYVAWRGFDDHLNIEDVNTGHKTTLPETTSAAPALAVFKGRLVVAWTGTDPEHHLNVESSTDGMNFGNKGTLAYCTFASDGPALAAYNGSDAPAGGDLEIAWTGTDTNLNDASSTDGKNFGVAHTFGIYFRATSQYGPALATYNGHLNVAWTGTDNRVNFMDLFNGAKDTTNAISHNAPSLATAPNGDLCLALTWADNQQLLLLDTVTGFYHAITEYSPYGPSLAYDSAGTRYIAWTGIDYNGSLNYEIV